MTSCIVKGCMVNWRSDVPGLILHSFPDDVDLVKSWLLRTGLHFRDLDETCRKIIRDKSESDFRICSCHFSAECYTTADGSRRTLKKDALPTLFLQPSSCPPLHSGMIQIKTEECDSDSSSSPEASRTNTSTMTPPLKMEEQYSQGSSTSPLRPEQEQSGEVTSRCIVTDCPNFMEIQHPDVTVHMFPNNFAMVKVWLQQTGQNFGDLDLAARQVLDMSPSERFGMCSDHFSPSSYMIHGAEIKLKPDALPTIFPGLQRNIIKEEEVELPFQPVSSFDGPFPSNVHADYNHNLRHVATSTDPYWGVQSIGVLTRPILVREASTSTRVGKFYNGMKTVRCTADKAIQCSEFELNRRGDSWNVRPDYLYRFGPAVPPRDMTAGEPETMGPNQETEDQGLQNWTALLQGLTPDNSRLPRNVPVKDSRLFFAMEEVMVSLMQHLLNTPFIEEASKLVTQKFLNQVLEIVALLTGDKWVLSERDDLPDSQEEVPVKCDDVAMYFSMDEWDYIKSHKELYSDLVIEEPQELTELAEDTDSDESVSEEEAKEKAERSNSPEWLPEGVVSEYSESELLSDDEDGEDLMQGDEDFSSSLPGSSSLLKEDGTSNGSSRMKRHSLLRKKGGVYHCKKCDMTFPKRLAFKRHLKSQKHLKSFVEEVEVACEDCDEVFVTKSLLIKHRAENHAVKRYACTICGIQYDYKSQFIIHQRAHTGEKPFECEQCGRKFGHKCSLLVHQRRHVKGKTVSCSKCDHRFDTKSQLAKHEKIHDHEKPIMCRLCGKRFAHKSHFMKHKWAFHHEDI
ncbi:zinc finger and SCAN domain-containing protein 2-like [Bufo gargarizans]|uniref:zinc finger and SCAN domain-containing protein 2-like n=1 Tax=Bufo gargarizans TaxID=30331 RepID=UPI001CF33384|nr:zinc finger and SCAN domain-containing protein 2-like [Bufo gargarizans]